MKKHVFNTAAMLFAVLILSCNESTNESNTTDTTMVVNESNLPSTSDTAMSSSTSSTMITNDFVSKAAAGGMMEVEMGRLAQANGGRDDVKAYGKMLEDDHSAANEKLKGIATAQNISVPATMTAEQTEHLDHLKSLTGSKFDIAYIDMMIDDHKKDIAEFKKAAAGNENEQVKNFASTTVPTLETHLSTAQAIKKKLK